jgi:hypothetical protein
MSQIDTVLTRKFRGLREARAVRWAVAVRLLRVPKGSYDVVLWGASALDAG